MPARSQTEVLPPPRQERSSSESVRLRIRQAALEQFSGQGYSRTTTRSIARAARVSESALFRHFSGKSELLREVFPHLLPEEETSARMGTGELEEDLRLCFSECMRLHVRHLPVYRLTLSLVDEREFADLLALSSAPIVRMVATVTSGLEALRMDGRIRDIDYFPLVEYLFSTFLMKVMQIESDIANGMNTTLDAAIDDYAREQASLCAHVILNQEKSFPSPQGRR